MNPNLKIYAICLVVLFFKMSGIGIFQGITRSKKKAFLTPEDARFFNKSDQLNAEPPELIRSGHAFRNDFENIPIFLFLALVYVMLDCWETGAVIYFTTFTLARIFHTVAYIKGLQPWRSISFGVGTMMSTIIAFHILYKVLA